MGVILGPYLSMLLSRGSRVETTEYMGVDAISAKDERQKHGGCFRILFFLCNLLPALTVLLPITPATVQNPQMTCDRDLILSTWGTPTKSYLTCRSMMSDVQESSFSPHKHCLHFSSPVRHSYLHAWPRWSPAPYIVCDCLS